MLYAAYELQRQLATPVRLWANALEQVYYQPLQPAFRHLVRQVGGGERRDHGAAHPELRQARLRPEDHRDRQRDRRGQRRDPAAQAVLPAAALPPRHHTARSQGAGGGADERPLRHPAARHGRGAAARPRRAHHRLGRRPRGAALAGQLRSRRLRRLRHGVLPLSRARRPCHRRLPAVGAGDGGGRADGRRQGSAPAAIDHPDGRPDRHARQPDHAQRSGDAQLDDVVPPERHLDGALHLSGRDAAGLSGLPAAHLVHQHEPRPAHQRPHAPVRASRERRRRFGRRPPRLLRRVSRGHGPHRRVLPADHPGRVQGAPAAARRLGEPRPHGRSLARSRPR